MRSTCCTRHEIVSVGSTAATCPNRQPDLVARKGGPRLGESSENLLLGLLWWAWRDTGVEPAAREAVLQRAAAGAWARLPDVGVRAPSPGGVVLRMLAGLGGEALESVRRRGAERPRAKLASAMRSSSHVVALN